jgi:ATP adenylyltransferase
MDRLYTPWRYAFLTAEKPAGCIFCAKIEMSDQDALIVHRGEHCYVCLNAFPYNNGHVMIIPYQHTHSLAELPAEAAAEVMTLAQRSETVLRSTYNPDGLNLGMNLGHAAGAGIAEHIHLHAVPRWSGDANFMTTVGDTRVLPETLEQTWERLHKAFAESI